MVRQTWIRLVNHVATNRLGIERKIDDFTVGDADQVLKFFYKASDQSLKALEREVWSL